VPSLGAVPGSATNFMRKILVISVLLLTIIGCKPSGCKPKEVYTENKSDIIVTNVLGHKFRFISPEIPNADGTARAELWERIDPLDTNRWYTRSLSSQIRTNDVPIFHSFPR